MAIDIGGDDGLQQHEEGEQAEGGVEAGLVGDEADDGGAHEDAEVAECADGRHSEADGHDALLAEQGEEDGHDVGAADADGEEAEVEQRRLSGEDDEQEAGDGQQAATDDDALLGSWPSFCTVQSPNRRIVSMAAEKTVKAVPARDMSKWRTVVRKTPPQSMMAPSTRKAMQAMMPTKVTMPFGSASSLPPASPP